jgi:signal transduction histidine kinase
VQKLKAKPGMGMTSMAERIEFLSGEFHVGKRKNGGTLIAVEVPIT